MDSGRPVRKGWMYVVPWEKRAVYFPFKPASFPLTRLFHFASIAEREQLVFID